MNTHEVQQFLDLIKRLDDAGERILSLSIEVFSDSGRYITLEAKECWTRNRLDFGEAVIFPKTLPNAERIIKEVLKADAEE